MKLLFVIIVTIFLSFNNILALNSKSHSNIKSKVKKEDTLEDEFDENDNYSEQKMSRREGGKNKAAKRDNEEDEEAEDDDKKKKPHKISQTNKAGGNQRQPNNINKPAGGNKKDMIKDVLNTVATGNSTSQNSLDIKMHGEKAKKYAGLFQSPNRGPACNKLAKKKRDSKNKKGDEGDKFLHAPLPIVKPSPDDAGYGLKGDVAYWFDYIDACWRDEITGIMTKIFDEAKAIKVDDNDTNDIYSVTNQLKNYASSGMESQIPMEILSENTPSAIKQQTKVLQKINPKFNPQIFENSISLPQIRKLVVEWNWLNDKMMDWADPGKHIVDKYDWDGDGRLNAREFIYWTISDNITELIKDKSKDRTPTYESFIDNQLDPFFVYADCDGDGYLKSENLWFTGELLKCKDPSKFQIYKCDAKLDDSESDYRTASTNDFILKNQEKADGFINKEEFYQGILLGFWDRQCSPGQGVVTGIEHSNIPARWGGGGTVDIECGIIKRIRSENRR